MHFPDKISSCEILCRYEYAPGCGGLWETAQLVHRYNDNAALLYASMFNSFYTVCFSVCLRCCVTLAAFLCPVIAVEFEMSLS